MKIYKTSFVIVLVVALSLVVAVPLQTVFAGAPPAPYFNGFEMDISGWDTSSTLADNPVRVASGTNGISASAGGWYAQTAASNRTPFTRWGGYSSVFPPGGYSTLIDIYLDVNGGFANDTRFDFTSAITNTSGSHRRDFVFNAGFYNDAIAPGTGNRFVISASNNAGRSSSFPKNPGRDPISISQSGWYTFKHTFRDNGSGVLAVDLTILDSTKTVVKTWTLSDVTDIIGSTVGGNRYGWFASNEFPFLAFDNTERTGSDTTPPVISYVLTPASPDGSNGWYKSNVTLTWTVAEPETPWTLLISGCVDQNIISDQATTDYSCSATSQGGAAEPVTVSIKRDATNPTLTWNGGPVDGVPYYLSSVPAAPTCNAIDSLSGPYSCTVIGYDTTPGSHTMTATAYDVAGNSYSETRTYTVIYNWNGFFQPVDNPGPGPTYVFNRVKAGSSIPVKFSLGGYQGLTIFAAGSPTSTRVDCGTSSSMDDIEQTVTSGSSSLSYDSTSDQYIYVWKTDKAWAVSCRKLTVKLNDGTEHVAYFNFTR